jgi:hypothetical protein
LFAVAIEAAEALLLLFGSVPVSSDQQKRLPRRQIVPRSSMTYWRVHGSATPKRRRHGGSAPASASVTPAIRAAELKGFPNTTMADAPAKRDDRPPHQ